MSMVIVITGQFYSDNSNYLDGWNIKTKENQQQ